MGEHHVDSHERDVFDRPIVLEWLTERRAGPRVPNARGAVFASRDHDLGVDGDGSDWPVVPEGGRDRFALGQIPESSRAVRVYRGQSVKRLAVVVKRRRGHRAVERQQGVKHAIPLRRVSRDNTPAAGLIDREQPSAVVQQENLTQPAKGARRQNILAAGRVPPSEGALVVYRDDHVRD